MSFSEKLTVIELFFSLIGEHNERMRQLIYELEELYPQLQTSDVKILKEARAIAPSEKRLSKIKINLKEYM